MTPERWRQVAALYDDALARDASEREAFLHHACADDAALRREVESLLAHEGSAERLLGSSTLTAMAEGMAAADEPSLVGRLVGGYQVLSRLGAGGMGEVYRARDLKLGRDVAIKVMPPHFTADRDRLARFEREARLLAALNHPHIGAIYGLEDFEGLRALVLELVEGETLSEKLGDKPSRGLPLADALPIARQIAEALEAAHEKGIVHRDLKPANIKITPTGVVKVLDFGLAKGGDSGAPDLSRSPTVTLGGTQAGVILGTAAYMSPEQARGQAVDKRTDIWAFGCVLYEMLTGRAPFPGDTVSDHIAAILERNPDWTALPADTPAPIRTLLRRCLRKDLQLRLPHIGLARLEIDEGLTTSDDTHLVSHTNPAKLVLPWAITAALALALGGVISLRAPGRDAPSSASVRLSAELGADVSLSNSVVGDAAILSPDGTTLVFVAQRAGARSAQLHVRRLDQLLPAPLSGTDGADSPFFSPDGQWIGFFASGRLKKVSLTGGEVVTLCDAPNPRGGAWSDDGTIVFGQTIIGVGLLRVSSAGGKPEPLTILAEGEVTQRWPQMLPGGKAVLFTSSGSLGAYDEANLVVQVLPTGERTVVHRGGYHGRYLPSGLASKRGERTGGHLLYIHDGTLFAASFDLGRLAFSGQAVAVLQGVTTDPVTGGAQFAVSASGTLVYQPGQSANAETPIHWMGPDGQATLLRTALANWFFPAFAPDGRRLAMTILDGQQHIWVYEWERDTLRRLSSDPVVAGPVWTPDGRRIVFASARGEESKPNLYLQLADGTGEAQRLTESKDGQIPFSWHPSGKFLAFTTNVQGNADVMILPLEGDDVSGWKAGTPRAFLNSSYVEGEPAFSPDGRWIAYRSNASGLMNVHVTPFPGPGPKLQISVEGGSFPTWSRMKRELLYGTTNGSIMVASFTADGDVFRAEKPRLWSDGRFVVRSQRSFDLHPDGERLALAAQTQGAMKPDHLTFIMNFFDELRRIAPVAIK